MCFPFRAEVPALSWRLELIYTAPHARTNLQVKHDFNADPCTRMIMRQQKSAKSRLNMPQRFRILLIQASTALCRCNHLNDHTNRPYALKRYGMINTKIGIRHIITGIYASPIPSRRGFQSNARKTRSILLRAFLNRRL